MRAPGGIGPHSCAPPLFIVAAAGGKASKWLELRDAATGNGYYLNVEKGETTWDMPADFDGVPRDDAAREKLAGARLRAAKVRRGGGGLRSRCG